MDLNQKKYKDFMDWLDNIASEVYDYIAKEEKDKTITPSDSIVTKYMGIKAFHEVFERMARIITRAKDTSLPDLALQKEKEVIRAFDEVMNRYEKERKKNENA
jgi:mRNA deadenylase 3'-5' endonuclease subunit Ccr4